MTGLGGRAGRGLVEGLSLFVWLLLDIGVEDMFGGEKIFWSGTFPPGNWGATEDTGLPIGMVRLLSDCGKGATTPTPWP